VEPFDGGFRVNNGGGNLNFASPVPEPETYALLMAGLGGNGLRGPAQEEQSVIDFYAVTASGPALGAKSRPN
jgi:hypothetical protein